MSWQAGQRVGDYRLERKLGRGGMGSVWLAEHLPTRSARALKHLDDADPELRERFRREGEALGRLTHPHVLGVHESFEFGPDLVLVTEVASGGDLQARLRSGPLALQAALDLIRGLASALDAAHAKGILHRDLKPANILFDEEGRPLLADFGVARLVDRASLTASGALLGTPAYLAPELTTGGAPEVRSEVYGLAAILYACLAGKAPFERGNLLQTLRAVAEDPPDPLPESIPAVVREACLRGMAKAPQARFATPAEFSAALSGAAAPRRWPVLAALAAVLTLAFGVVLLALDRSRERRSTSAAPSRSAPSARVPLDQSSSPAPWTPPPSGVTLGRRTQDLWVAASWIDERRFLLVRGTRYRRYQVNAGLEPLEPWQHFPRPPREGHDRYAPTRLLHATEAGFFHGGWTEPAVFVPWGGAPQAIPPPTGISLPLGVTKGAELPAGTTTGLLWVSLRTPGTHRVVAYDLEQRAWTHRLAPPQFSGNWECHVLAGRSDGTVCAIYRLNQDHRLLFWRPGSEIQVTQLVGLSERGAAWLGSDLWVSNRRAQLFRFRPGHPAPLGNTPPVNLHRDLPLGGVESRGLWALPSQRLVTVGLDPLNLVEWDQLTYTSGAPIWEIKGVLGAGASFSPNGRWAVLAGSQGQAYLISTSD